MSLIYSAIRRAGDEHGNAHVAPSRHGGSGCTHLSTEADAQRASGMARLRGGLAGVAASVSLGVLFGALYAHGGVSGWFASSTQPAGAEPRVVIDASASVDASTVSLVTGDGVPAIASNQLVVHPAENQVERTATPPEALHAEADRYENHTPAATSVQRESVRAPEPPKAQTSIKTEERPTSQPPTPVIKPVERPVVPPVLAQPSVVSAKLAEPVSPTPRETDRSPMLEKQAVVDIRVARPGATEVKAVPDLVDAFRQAMGERNFLQAEVELRALRDALPPQSLTLMRLEGWLALESGELERARSTYAVILNREPTDLNTGLNMGLALYRLGRREEAMRQIEQLLRHHPGHQGARDFLMRMQKED